MNVAAQPVQFADADRAGLAVGPRLGERRLELGPAIEGVGALARFDLDMLSDDLEALGLREADDRRALRLDPQPERPCSALLTRR